MSGPEKEWPIKILRRRLEWAFGLALPRPARWVLLSIVNHCNEDGGCHPSVERMMRETTLGRRAVFYGLRYLEAHRVIGTAPRTNAPSEYTLKETTRLLASPCGCTWCTRALGASVHGRGAPADAGGVHGRGAPSAPKPELQDLNCLDLKSGPGARAREEHAPESANGIVNRVLRRRGLAQG